MSAISILILSGILGLLSSSIYFIVSYRNMNMERNRLISDVNRLENEFLTEFKQINFDELKETAAGKELLDSLQDSEIFPKNIPDESSSLKSMVLKSVKTMQSNAERQNVDFHLDIVDPPSLTEVKGKWQTVFDQLVHETIKYSLQGKYGKPNIIRIYGRKGENYYIITLENYGKNLNDEIFEKPSLPDISLRDWFKQKFRLILWTERDIIEKQGGKIVIGNSEIDKAESEIESKNSLNQITLYIPVEPPSKK